MRKLYEYLSNKEEIVLVSSHKLGVHPSKALGKINGEVVDVIDDQVKSLVVDAVGQWYDDNQRRRNIEVITSVNVMVDYSEQSSLWNDVASELKRIGVVGMIKELAGSPKNWYDWDNVGSKRLTLTTSTYKQFKEGKYKFDLKSLSEQNIQPTDRIYGNAYNNLPVEDCKILIERFYDCMKDLNCEIVLEKDTNSSGLPSYTVRVKLGVVYDNTKLKKLLNDITNDARLQQFARSMDAMSRGIANYYASKKPGDYTGD